KAFLSRQVDRYRKPWGRSFVEWPRQCVFVGTTNSEDYLRDVTGNRRVWPVRCAHADVEWIEANRDQLWAEAAARERAGEGLWLDLEEAREGAQQAQEARTSQDVWTDRAREYLASTTVCRVPALLSHIGVPIERQSKREEMRAAAILTLEGWCRKVEWMNGRPTRLWRPKPKQ
ncbi:MAG TPA: VapE domain-containing protein, partial [Acetobacteraceae bacterium]|nr:VapE domain-containing protein [Acetobacteraceae bacterium]